MRIYLTLVAFALAAGTAGCKELTKEGISSEVEQTVRDSDFQVKEIRTLSNLAKLEEALSAYVSAEKKIPDTPELLVPKYLADIPTVEIAVRGHRDNNEVKLYPAAVLRDGKVDGSKLRDTGRWGYVFNDRQVVVFVDCTHNSSRGRPWYLERGVY